MDLSQPMDSMVRMVKMQTPLAVAVAVVLEESLCFSDNQLVFRVQRLFQQAPEDLVRVVVVMVQTEKLEK
jgi:hypothetical protein